ncbi:16S rRNA (guanine(966)-N(2))-methyltransferase RsmD [Sedimenticola selenatireducens]|uniref:Ribosomal RNA small subunit methyltransferase D n=1 Tax=Sedimenticola selenatireducens TaxID=191960 RepID=A0A558DXV9_9GAMM|nr:16S rRNA (guanine(966)-N(2))-methyltransferase RsmD [Sedimenticola selenatireducens]TVO70981.1 16S rRNA (guanine(966)-N(2))-methyltransferase RsmD [Sedimenticola selenatireducens]TVT65847.1 MAG: 16S rRNA (guanine(966)-N(2))-methyltransferase RsmD [Sedimenticola selenatireducens]
MSRSRSTEAGQSRGKRPSPTNQIRIVGGECRGRRLIFPDSPGLRPTSDRTRETLFNWLQPILPGAVCLDLFAGSGALGFEAASRGARHVTLVEHNPKVARQLQDNQQLLGLEQLSLQQGDALSWLEQKATAFDIVFLDPPFADQLLSECCLKLDQNGWLANNPRIYLEWDLNGPMPKIPAHWQALKEKKAGQVAYALYTR